MYVYNAHNAGRRGSLRSTRKSPTSGDKTKCKSPTSGDKTKCMSPTDGDKTKCKSPTNGSKPLKRLTQRKAALQQLSSIYTTTTNEYINIDEGCGIGKAAAAAGVKFTWMHSRAAELLRNSHELPPAVNKSSVARHGENGLAEKPQVPRCVGALRDEA